MSNGKIKGKQIVDIILEPDSTPLNLASYSVSATGSGKQLVNKEYIDGITHSLQEVTDFGNTTSNDLEITEPESGLILKSPDGNRWKITINNDGQLLAEQL
jgi:hypothetical protein